MSGCTFKVVVTRTTRYFVALCMITTGLAGCVTSADVNDQTRQVAKTKPCCATPSELNFAPLQSKFFGDNYEITDKSPVFAFETGVSPFLAFELPAPDVSRRLRIEGVHALNPDPFANFVFLPLVLMLDADRKVIRTTRPSDLSYNFRTPWIEFTVWKGDSVRYVIIYTSPQLIAGGAVSSRSGTVALPSGSGTSFVSTSGSVTNYGTYYGKVRIRLHDL